MQKYRFIIVFFIIIAFLGSLYGHKLRARKRQYVDFHCFYLAGERLLKQENIYVMKDKETAEFRYAPVFALLMSGMALMSEDAADTLWYSINFFLLIISLVLLKKIFIPLEKTTDFNPVRDKSLNGVRERGSLTGFIPQQLNYKKLLMIYLLSILGVITYVSHNLQAGQSNILMLTSIVIGLYFISKNRYLLGSFIFAFSVMIKYTPLIFIPYFYLRKGGRVALAMIISVLIYFVLPALFIGFRLNFYYIKTLIPFLTQSTIFEQLTILNNKNQSLLSLIHRLFTNCIAYFHAPPMPFQSLGLKENQLNIIFITVSIILYLLILYPGKKTKLPQYIYPHTKIFGVRVYTNIFSFTLQNEICGRASENNSAKQHRIIPLDLRSRIDYALLLICSALFNPNAWRPTYIFLAPGYFILAHYLVTTSFKDKLVLVLLLSSYLLSIITAKSILGETLAHKLYFYSPVTLSALLVFAALLKIKFFARVIVGGTFSGKMSPTMG